MNPITGPEYTNRFNLFRTAELTGIPAPGYSSSQALTALQEVAAATLPQGWSYDWSNMSCQEVKAAGQGAVVFLFALLFVFLILAAQYESWTLPMSVLLGTPFAVFGAMLGLFISRFFSDSYVNNVFAQIGLVTLIGLAAKNAILIVEFAKEKRAKGAPADEAALESARLRIRPILMTSFAFILGVLPLVRAAGAGAEARKVMGMAVFAGLLVATTLAIYLIPTLYVMAQAWRWAIFSSMAWIAGYILFGIFIPEQMGLLCWPFSGRDPGCGAMADPEAGTGLGRLVDPDQHHRLEHRIDADAWPVHIRCLTRCPNRVDAGDPVSIHV